MEEEQYDDAPDEVAIPEEQMLEMRSGGRDGDEQRTQQSEVSGHQPASDEQKRQADGDGECGVEGTSQHDARRIQAICEERRDQMTRWKDPEDLVIERLSVEHLHRGVEWPALVHGAQAVMDEEGLESDAHRQQDQAVDEKLAIETTR